MWTIVPPELVWEGIEREPKKLQQIQWHNAQVLIEPIDFGRGRVVQVLSTEPNDFLRPDLAPGAIINLGS